ncbi:hypothetical protein F5878DRAFT_535390, partial [Lentinula raphanica]
MLKDVIHCPTAPYNLISVSRLTDAGFSAVFNGNMVEIRSLKTGIILAIADKVSHLYRLRISPGFLTGSIPDDSTYSFPARSWDDWH